MRNKLQTILIGIGLLWGSILANSSTINTINVGSSANDGTGDTLRAAFQKVNSNDAALNADKVENSNGSASGLTLSGTTTIGGTLDVSSATTLTGLDSPNEVAETVTNGQPSLWFDGSADFVSVANNAGLIPSDGTDDLPQTIAFWVKLENWTKSSQQQLFSKWSGNRGYTVLIPASSGDIRLAKGDGSNTVTRQTATSLGGYNGKWVHVVVVDSGSGPNSDDAFTNALDSLAIYINAESVALDAASGSSYTGMTTSATAAVELMSLGGVNFAEGEIRNAQIFQSALSAADVETIYRSGVPFELDQASATAIYESDYTSNSTDSWTATRATLDATQTIGGDSDNIQIVVDGTASNTHFGARPNSFSQIGKRMRVTGEYYLPSGNAIVDSFGILRGGTGSYATAASSFVTDSWTAFSIETDIDGNDSNLRFYLADDNVTNFSGNSSDYIALKNIVVKDAGCILDLDIGATDFSAASDNIPDRSANSFEGTLNSMTEANGVGFPAGLYVNNPSPSANQNLIVAENAGTQVFAVDEDGDLTIESDLIITNSTTPASASATGTAGTIAWDSSYIYICTATDTWKRVAISTW